MKWIDMLRHLAALPNERVQSLALTKTNVFYISTYSINCLSILHG